MCPLYDLPMRVTALVGLLSATALAAPAQQTLPPLLGDVPANARIYVRASPVRPAHFAVWTDPGGTVQSIFHESGPACTAEIRCP